MTRVLVSGGAGYIGSFTARLLARSGMHLVVLDNLSTGFQTNARWGRFVTGDLADAPLLRRLLREEAIDAVIHFAACAYVGESMQAPREYFRNNVTGSLNLLDAMLDAGVRQIVFSSTCATYGLPERLPIDEAHSQCPMNPYGESKLFLERTLRWYGEAYGLNWVALRYFNVAGADPEGELGEQHEPETHLVPLVIQAALGRRSHLDVYGTDYPTADGTAVRDYIHPIDIADAHLAALRYLIGSGASIALNLGTGQGYSVRQIIEAVERVSGWSVPLIEAPRRSGDPPELVADPRAASEILGWRARSSGLDLIASTAWRWHAQRATEP